MQVGQVSGKTRAAYSTGLLLFVHRLLLFLNTTHLASTDTAVVVKTKVYQCYYAFA